MFELRQSDMFMDTAGCGEALLVSGALTAFLSAEYYSPYQNELALAIAERLTRRVERTKEEYNLDQQKRGGQCGAIGDNSPITSMLFGI